MSPRLDISIFKQYHIPHRPACRTHVPGGSIGRRLQSLQVAGFSVGSPIIAPLPSLLLPRPPPRPSGARYTIHRSFHRPQHIHPSPTLRSAGSPPPRADARESGEREPIGSALSSLDNRYSSASAKSLGDNPASNSLTTTFNFSGFTYFITRARTAALRPCGSHDSEGVSPNAWNFLALARFFRILSIHTPSGRCSHRNSLLSFRRDASARRAFSRTLNTDHGADRMPRANKRYGGCEWQKWLIIVDDLSISAFKPQSSFRYKRLMPNARATCIIHMGAALLRRQLSTVETAG